MLPAVLLNPSADTAHHDEDMRSSDPPDNLTVLVPFSPISMKMLTDRYVNQCCHREQRLMKEEINATEDKLRQLKYRYNSQASIAKLPPEIRA